MFNDAKPDPRLAAIVERVLIIEAEPASARLLAERLRQVCPCQIWTAHDAGEGLALAERIDPGLVFVGHGAKLDGAGLTRQLRRGDLDCRKAPVILVSSVATAAVMVDARDAGAHELLRRPFALADLTRHLEAVALKPRSWIEGVGYVGPDRRRFNAGDYSDQLKRRVEHAVTAGDARIAQALRILQAAVQAVEVDPRQALRALIAQTDEIGAVAGGQGDEELESWAVALRQWLADASPSMLRRPLLEPMVAPLLSRCPGEPPALRLAAA